MKKETPSSELKCPNCSSTNLKCIYFGGKLSHIACLDCALGEENSDILRIVAKEKLHLASHTEDWWSKFLPAPTTMPIGN